MPRVTGSLVTENDLNGQFIPNAGHAPGTDNSQLLSCSQVNDRYAVNIDNYISGRMPSWEQIESAVEVDYIPFGPTAVTDTDLYIYNGGWIYKFPLSNISSKTGTRINPGNFIQWGGNGVITFQALGSLLYYAHEIAGAAGNLCEFRVNDNDEQVITSNTSTHPAGSIAARPIPATSGLQSWIFLKPDTTLEPISRYELGVSNPSKQGLGTNNSAVNSWANDLWITCSLSSLWIMHTVGLAAPGVELWHVNIGMNPPFNATKVYSDGGWREHNHRMAAVNSYQGVAYSGDMVFILHERPDSDYEIEGRGTDGQVKSSIVIPAAWDIYIAGPLEGSGRQYMYFNKDEGSGLGRIARCSGSSYSWLTS